jgi:membrane-bound lytic murein transglycosylase D
MVKANQPVALVVVPEETVKTPSESANSSEPTIVDDRITIRKGDTLYSLSKRFGTTVKQLQDWNDLRGTNLQIGFHLRVR